MIPIDFAWQRGFVGQLPPALTNSLFDDNDPGDMTFPLKQMSRCPANVSGHLCSHGVFIGYPSHAIATKQSSHTFPALPPPFC